MEEILTDPISMEIMESPCITSCGHSFSEQTIRAWVSKSGACPVCKHPMTVADIKPNYTLRDAVAHFHSERAKGQPGGPSQILDPPPQIIPPPELLAASPVFSPAHAPMPPSDSIVLKEILPSQAEEAAATLSGSFIDDPYMRFIFSGPVDLKASRWFFSTILKYALTEGRVWVATDGEKLHGVAIWQPPFYQGVSLWRMATVGMAAAPFKFGIANSFRLLQMLNVTEATHLRLMNGQPHWCLYTIAVDANSRRKKIGSGLISQVLSAIDRDKLPVYLDLANPDIIPFFAQQGFRVIEENRSLPGFKFWSMMRDPAP